ncbi:MAG: type I-E CRISPR-associated protein Cas6/Cse3/CasE [Armatimonadetes bacterium]|nr:type I-E CRISPR-associated protein Cas6/Cse3/CasE [Armatimonadota bacterium]
MILSRIEFDPYNPKVYGLIADPYRIHQLLTELWGATRTSQNILFRIEPIRPKEGSLAPIGPTILIQSDSAPDWSRWVLREMCAQSPESKEVQIEVQAGQLLEFRLRCRPCKKQASPGKKNSQFKFLRSEGEQVEWLMRQAESAGFRLVSVELTREDWEDTKPGNPRPDDKRERQLGAVRFDGQLQVTDPEQFLAAVRKGIGPQKAYGFGLVSLRKL